MTIPGPKSDSRPIPAGADPNKYLRASDYNALRDSILAPNDSLVTSTGGTTARSLASRFSDVVNVKDYGAKGDGVTDDTAAIQAAVNAASAAGVKEVRAPGGTYKITASISIPSDVQFVGVKGATLKASGPWFSPMVKLWGVQRAGIIGFTLDGDAVARGLGASDPPSDGINITSSSYCTAERNRIINVGRPSDPGGTGILIDAWDVGETFTDTTQYWPQLKPKAPSRFNRVVFNTVEDPAELLYFPIRLLTIWYHLGSYTYTSPVEHNLVDGNTVTGGNWNAIEIAGPATRYNTISNNFAKDVHQSGIESDKGASYNTFIGNVIDGVTAKLPGSLTSDLSAGGMRAQGYKDATYLWRAKGNIFKGNVIRNITATGSSDDANGFQFAWADDTLVEGNVIESVTRTGDGAGTGVKFYGMADHNTVRGNRIAGARLGVAVDSESEASMDGAVIDGNRIEAWSAGVRTFISPGRAGSAYDWTVSNNSIVGATADAPLSGTGVWMEALASDRAIVRGNRIHNWQTGIKTQAPGSFVEGNRLTEITFIGVVTQANSTIDTVVSNNLYTIAASGVQASARAYRFDVQTQAHGNRRVGQSSGVNPDHEHSARIFTGSTQPTAGMRGDVWFNSAPVAGASPGAVCTGTNTWKAMANLAP